MNRPGAASRRSFLTRLTTSRGRRESGASRLVLYVLRMPGKTNAIRST
jgi:hypothetical protein